MNQFRVASRELFNPFFRVDDPYGSDQAWVTAQRCSEVQEPLFQKLVPEPCSLPWVAHGRINARIVATLRHGDVAPIMPNREVDSGHWDHPVREVTRDPGLAFVSFFDCDPLDCRDHRYVRVQVLERPTQPAVVGKHAFIEAHYVRFGEG